MSTTGRSLRPRTAAIKRKYNSDFVDSSTLSKTVLNGRITKTSQTKAKVARFANRSTSAPPVNFKFRKTWGAKIYTDVKNPSDMDWTDKSKKGIRLVYPELTPGQGSNQGILLTPPCITSSTDTQLHQHLDALRDNMLTYQQPHQITESTGEAATAVCMLLRFPGAKMQWGAHLHSGAGIDQIWTQVSGTGQTIFYIVEAKGVGATLTYKKFGPPDEIKQQMSLGWVLDNLVRMAHQDGSEYNIARTALKKNGLVEVLNDQGGPYYANFGGVSKSYYACSYDPNKRVNTGLVGVVVTAVWTTGDLSYDVKVIDFGAQLPTSPAIIPLT